jgi:cell division septum initiation protein DivIVA
MVQSQRGGQAVSIIDQIAFDQIADERDKAQQENKLLKQRIKRLEEVGDKLYSAIYCGCLMDGPCKACSDAADMWDEIKEAKP